MFAVTMTNAFTNAATSIAQTAVKDAITLLAEKYGFDAQEAEQFLMGGGVQIKKETIPRNALPWCGMVVEENCRALAYNSGLFTQCPQKRKGDGTWCTKCAKQVAEHGTPNNGDVDQRKACGIMAYKVGKRTVIPYGDYMKRHKYEREDVEAAATKYGMTIDPIQFECKKRGRPTTTTLHMTTPLQDLPEPEEESEVAPAPKAAEPEPTPAAAEPTPAAAEPAPEPTPAAEPEPTPATEPKAKPSEQEEGELEEEDVEDEDEDEDEETYTAEEIDKMLIADLRKLAESCGIATKENGKAIKVKQLQTIVKEHFQV
jgi:hypothetical protein